MLFTQNNCSKTTRRSSAVFVLLAAFSADARRVDIVSVGPWKTDLLTGVDESIWERPNVCEESVLRGSAPLTTSYGIELVWDEIASRRTKSDRQLEPLEVHVLGASYPFEGRSDWSFLASQRPDDIPSVRVTLVLGTPFQSDNVPPIEGQKSGLLQVSDQTFKLRGRGVARHVAPDGGHWDDARSQITCDGGGSWGTGQLDGKWSKEDLCRDHGNGLEVICIEDFYQNVKANLIEPDFVAMFSPGMPQIARRSWDNVMIGLLGDSVPVMVSDVVSADTWGHKITPDGRPVSGSGVEPGGEWDASISFGEDFTTALAFNAYGARRLQARRSLFPILHSEGDTTMGKNGVIQVFKGYADGRDAVLVPSAEDAAQYAERFNAVDWSDQLGMDNTLSFKEVYDALQTPTSAAFDAACKAMYYDNLRTIAKKRLAKKKLSEEQVSRLHHYGLLDPSGKKQQADHGAPWDLEAWVFLLRALGSEFV